jgi:hypothetical protein
MSDTAPWWKPSLKSGTFLTSAGQAGPRRLLIIGVSGLVLVTMAVIVITSGHHVQPFSQDAHMKPVDPLPGGLHTTPEQDQLALQAETAGASTALAKGNSYTPPIAPSASVIAAPATSAPDHPGGGARLPGADDRRAASGTPADPGDACGRHQRQPPSRRGLQSADC